MKQKIKDWYKEEDGWFYTIVIPLGSLGVALILKAISYI